MGIVEQYLLQLNTKKQRFRRSVALLSVLSVLVMLTVSWNLRQTGVALANDACCGVEEHRHTMDCPMEKVLICGYDAEEPTQMPVEVTTEPSTEAPTEETTAATDVPAETATEAPVETFPEEPSEEPTEASTEAATEASTEAATEASTEAETEEPTEASAEAATEATTETPVESVAEMVLDAAADMLSALVPTAHAADIPEDEGHIHTDACYEITWLCGLEEHTHVLSCYSDVDADLEDWDTWYASIPELTGRISEDIVLVAQSQLGIKESDLNFEVAADGETRNGITRYGQWYGNPYGPWSNMFTSFCLRFAGLNNVPVNSGAEKMMMDWDAMNLYRYAGGYEPVAGDIVFLDKNLNGMVESTAIVVRYFDFVLTVIEGDVNDAVVQQEYRIDDPMIAGYGMTNSANRVMMFAAGANSSSKTIGTTETKYPTAAGTFILYATEGNTSYAIDGNGKAVPVQISDGNIFADVEDPATLYWELTVSRNSYTIKNASTGKYLYPQNGKLLNDSSQNLTLATSDSGATIRGARSGATNYYLQFNGTEFVSNTSGSTIYFGRAPKQYYLWLDGTNGNIMMLRDSVNTMYTVYSGIEVQLPSEWTSPAKYSYTLAGWVNIKTGAYYQPGDKIVVTEDTVLYADWVASTYDIGQYNSHVVDTVSTNDFVTTYLFDYSPVINLISTKTSESTLSASSHSETWTHVASDTATYGETLNFSFNDHDSAGTITNPNNRNAENNYTGSINGNNGHEVHQKIYTAALKDALFSVNSQVVGKHYLGTADHLFQLDTNPNSEFYGYYYYDARLNAASYNQSDGRFYVYDYLERASDSASNNSYSDFLPFNSPYANKNGKNVTTYEYNGGIHYSYDSRYDANSNTGSAANHVHANWWYGMRTDIQFGLPEDPGTGGNKDIYGNEMHFHFVGDDDVWVLIDDQVVLDLGGIHQEAEGDINFSTGEVTVKNGSKGTITTNLSDYGIKAGEYTLSILYLERGASMSNCGIYFNLAPRFSLTLQKEDVLTREILEGAKFGIYYDQACIDPCELWPTKQDYVPGTGIHEFVIEDGKLTVWGLSPSRTYYIKELSPPKPENKDDPDALKYASTIGVIKLTLDKNGVNSYSATVLPPVDKNGNEIGSVSNGFTVHGFRIDEENQAAYINITNAQNWVTETTSVHVKKKWGDTEDHTRDSVTVYLNVTDAKGTRRLREITLSMENNWEYSWANLPKYPIDTETNRENKEKELVYTVSEAHVPGYTYTIEDMGSDTITGGTWDEFTSFENGKEYLLKTDQGYLSAQPGNGNTLYFITDEAVAKESPLALWTATTSDGRVKLTNQNGQSLGFQRSRWYFSAGNSGEMNLTAIPLSNGLGLAVSTYQNQWYTENVFICGLNNQGYLGADNTPNTANALQFHPMVKGSSSTSVVTDGIGYIITNVPLETEVSVKVIKKWEYPTGEEELFQKAQITFKLLADGVDKDISQTVGLTDNNWTAIFTGLDYDNDDGEPIKYTVVEIWDNEDWIPIYGEMKTVVGSTHAYETTVTNRYRWIDAFELPATGGIGYPIFVLSGLILMSAPLVYGLSLRRRYRKGARR